MKYYEDHEQAYKKLKARGEETWDRKAYDEFFMRPFLEQVLGKLSFPMASPTALELGCGSGPVSCFLAERGFDVLGIDISSTAVDMARQQARRRTLSARFEVRDWLSMTHRREEYDVVVDGHFLHCIVHNHERAAALAAVRTVLKPGGAFIVETMVQSPAMDFGENFHYDTEGRLWARVRPDYPVDKTHIDGQWYVPNRRILSAERQEAELAEAGFSFVFKNIRVQSATEPNEFQAVCVVR